MQPMSLREQARWMVAYWRPYRHEVPILLILTIVNAAILVVYPIILKRIVNGIENATGAGFLLQNALVLVALGLGQFVVYVTMQTMRARLNTRFDFGVRQRAFEHLLDMGPTFFSRFRTGDLVTRLTDDITEKLSWYMCSGIFRVIEAFSIIIFGIVMMVRLNPELTLYAAGPLPVLIGLFIITAGKLHARYKTVQETISRLNEKLESCFSGIRVVKAFAAEDVQRRTVEAAVDDQRCAEIRAVRWQAVIDSLYGHIWQLAIVGVLLAGGVAAIQGSISLGDLIAFASYVLLLVWPMFDVGQFFVRGRLSAVTVGRISELEFTPPEVSDRLDGAPMPRRPDGPLITDISSPPTTTDRLTVHFDGVGFRYTDAGADVLNDVSFEAVPGSMTALAGEIGSGKSSALAMVPRVVDPTGGRLLVGGRDAREWPPQALRQAIGFVSQEPLLFSTSVRENIRFGREWIEDPAIEEAIDAARLREEIEGWTDGLETLVGSRGLRLSGGQKQRVALARALAGRPSILLLDDCTASLDAETEEAVWRDLLTALPSCTAIVVTHRPATLERADQIVVLDRGTVREIGDFAALNRPETYFHRLYVQWKLRDEVER